MAGGCTSDSRHGNAQKWRRFVRLPVAVFELENSRDDDRVAYSLSKVLCVRAGLRVVFAYRGNWGEGRALIGHLNEQVVRAVPTTQRMAVEGQTIVVLGSRGEAETFPYSYFKLWMMNANTGAFEKI